VSTSAAVQAAIDSIGGPNPIVGFCRKDLTDSLASVLVEVARNPMHTAASLAHLAKATLTVLRGQSDLRPGVKDRRFADPAWSSNFLYRALLQFYLASDRELDSWIGAARLSEVDRARVRYVLSLALDTSAPSNLLINPAAIRRLIDTGGGSAIFGLRHFVADLRGNGGLPSQVDTAGFAVGGNLAGTEGSVVYRNDVLELIQYTPRSPRVHQRPLVIAPPQINKFYVFDLSPEKSLVRYALEAAQQVFMISWRNPTKDQRDWGFGTYLTAVEEALETVTKITKSPDVNLLGACSGGITSVALAAYLTARGKPLINALTLLVSLFDTAEDSTLLGVFASEETLAAAKRRSHAAGVLDGRELGRVFSLMRPNDLIWPYWVNNYLLGNKPPAFDVLFWNNDTTRLPARFHGELIDIYRDNSLVTPGAVVINDTPLDVPAVNCDAFVMAGSTDHITPWEACYRSARQLSGAVEFVLSNSGHVQSILNPPANPKASYITNTEWPADPRAWHARASQQAGSWWPRWIEWLAARSGGLRRAAARLGNRVYSPLEPAPGRYVYG
jgi:polyhydroxyalkanoate synthase